MTIQTKTIGRMPTDHGPYDPELAYGEKFQCELFGCVWESLHDNNNTAPAVWDGGDIITPNPVDWKKASGDYNAWLINQDKPASTGTTGDHPYNGMGRVVLKKNMVGGVNVLTEDAFYTDGSISGQPLENTIFVIKYDFVLGEDITIPDNCVLEFDGGSISAGSSANMDTITLSNTKIQGTQKFNCKVEGSISNKEAYQSWFSSIDYYIDFINNTEGYNTLVFSKGVHNAQIRVNKTVKDILTVVGNGAEIVYSGTAYTDEVPYFYFVGYNAVGLPKAITSSVVKGAYNIPVATSDLSSFAIGDTVALKDKTEDSFYPCPNRNYMEGEYGIVKDIDSTNNYVVLTKPTYGNYKHVGSCYITKANISTLNVKDLSVKITDDYGNIKVMGIRARYLTCNFENLCAFNFTHNIEVEFAPSGYILNCIGSAHKRKSDSSPVDSYGLALSSCENVIVDGGQYFANTHGITIGGYSGAIDNGNIEPINRNIVVRNAISYSHRNQNGLDAHGNSQYITFRGCKANGVRFGGSNISVIDCDLIGGYYHIPAGNVAAPSITCQDALDMSHVLRGNKFSRLLIYGLYMEDSPENNYEVTTSDECMVIENNVFNGTMVNGNKIIEIDIKNGNYLYHNKANVSFIFKNNSITGLSWSNGGSPGLINLQGGKYVMQNNLFKKIDISHVSDDADFLCEGNEFSDCHIKVQPNGHDVIYRENEFNVSSSFDYNNRRSLELTMAVKSTQIINNVFNGGDMGVFVSGGTVSPLVMTGNKYFPETTSSKVQFLRYVSGSSSPWIIFAENQAISNYDIDSVFIGTTLYFGSNLSVHGNDVNVEGMYNVTAVTNVIGYADYVPV